VDLPAEYRLLNAPRLYGGLVINASESGLLVHAIKNMPVGIQLNLSVLFPKEYELTNFEVIADIVWKDILWADNREIYQFGLRFVSILEGDRQKLKRLLLEEFEITSRFISRGF
jgi:hypothetical protein